MKSPVDPIVMPAMAPAESPEDLGTGIGGAEAGGERCSTAAEHITPSPSVPM